GVNITSSGSSSARRNVPHSIILRSPSPTKCPPPTSKSWGLDPTDVPHGKLFSSFSCRRFRPFEDLFAAKELSPKLRVTDALQGNSLVNCKRRGGRRRLAEDHKYRFHPD